MKKAILAVAVLLILSLLVSLIIVWPAVSLQRVPFSAPGASYHSWDDVLSHPQPVTVQAYSTGMMQTELSGIMNLEHDQAQHIEDEVIDIPVVASLIQHQALGAYLIDAGLDASYAGNPYGQMRGIMVKIRMGKGSQDPDTQIAAILDRENIHLQGVLLTHLHFDHTAGILDLPKDIPCAVGKDELDEFQVFYSGRSSGRYRRTVRDRFCLGH